MAEIHHHKSDIFNYASTNKVEFFSVASEYFFENPQKMRVNHTELYNMLTKIFVRKKKHELY